MKHHLLCAVFLSSTLGLGVKTFAQTPPPAPALVEPAAGGALVQPVRIAWTEVTDPDGPIMRYDWQVSASSTFSSVIAWGFTSGSPPLFYDFLSGLPNGTYFVRVNCTQPATGLESTFSSARSFTITGLGPAPTVTPVFTAPANGSQFHEVEFFDIRWTESTDAHYYLLEADDEPSFSFPHNINNTPVMLFRNSAGAGYGFSSNIFYRVRPVSADNVRGLPSPSLSVQITNSAPIPPPPTPQVPANGAQVTVPFKFSWSPTPNPQGYDIHIDNDAGFAEPFVLFISNISRSDHLLDSGLAPGTYFWRVRAVHGNAIGGWSAGRSFTVVAGPPTPPGLTLSSLTLSPAWLPTGFSSLGTVFLTGAAPAGGASVHIASYFPIADVASDTVLVPEGATSASFPISTDFVEGLAVSGGFMGAIYGGALRTKSLSLSSLLWGTGFSADNTIGGTTVPARLILTAPAHVGGTEALLVSSHPELASVPTSVVVPEGETSTGFDIVTSPVSRPVIIKIHSAAEGSQAPSPLLKINPPGTPHLASLSALSLSPSSVSNGAPSTGLITLSGPAPAGGATVNLAGNTGGLIVLPGPVTIPAGATSATFTIATSPVLADTWMPIIATMPASNSQAAVLELTPGAAGTPAPSSVTFNPSSVVGSGNSIATLIINTPAPAGGLVVALASSNTAIATTPASVTLAEGATSTTFVVNTSVVSAPTSVSISATLNGVTRSGTLTVTPIPATLTSLTLNPATVVGGTSSTGTVTFNVPVPTGGQMVNLSSSNLAVATVPASITVAAGSTSANFVVSTSAVGVSTTSTITAVSGLSHNAVLTVSPPGPPDTGLRSPTANAPDTGGDNNGFEMFPNNAHDDDAFTAIDNNSGSGTSTSCTSSSKDKHRYYNYGFAVPAGATVLGLEVRLDAMVDSTSGSPKMCVQLSWNGGSSWTTTKSTPNLNTSMATYLLGGATDTWGRTWNSTELSDANFRIRVINVASSTSRDFSLDWIPVRILYQGGGPPAPVILTSLSLNPTSVTGGNSSTGTVSLSGAAPSGGSVVTLSSSNTVVATVPTSVTVAAGATSATFTVNTSTVQASTSVTISGTLDSTTQTADLTVTPVPTGPTTAFPNGTTILTGTLRGGTAANLNADDNVYYEVDSTTSGTRTTEWYGSFTGVSNTLTTLKITYKGKNSNTATQTIAVWRWTDSTWVQLDSRDVGTSEVLIADLMPGGTLADYVSGTSGDGEVRVRIRATRSFGSFFTSGDLLKIVYDLP